MTLVAAPIFVDTRSGLGTAFDIAREAHARGARIIEWRVDRLAMEKDAVSAVARLVTESPVPCIVTCRPAWEGGAYDGDEETRGAVLAAAADAGARYVDVELAVRARGGPVATHFLDGPGTEASSDAGGSGVVLSSHDYDGRPADLLQRVEAISAEPACAVAKIVWTARSLRDNLEAFDLLAERTRPTIALCMGPYGLMSRVLAPKFGGYLTFAATGQAAESAPGQPIISDLRDLYRFDDIGAATRVYGVIGWPVGHSLSPRIHNAGFSAVGHDGVYLPLPIPPEYEHFKATVGSMIDHPKLGFAGASVTIPHKGNLLRFVSERGGRIDPLAARIGAANTLVVGATGAIGCANTDCPAAVMALRRVLEVENLAERRVAVLGAGGVARAVVAGLHNAGAAVMIFNRSADRARDLAAAFDGCAPVLAASVEELARERYDVYVNCTPIGMLGGPDPDGTPLPDDAPLDDAAVVFDTVYNPVRTPLIRQAEARGAQIVTGLEMFVEQARLQFEMWTSGAAPDDFGVVVGA